MTPPYTQIQYIEDAFSEWLPAHLGFHLNIHWFLTSTPIPFTFCCWVATTHNTGTNYWYELFRVTPADLVQMRLGGDPQVFLRMKQLLKEQLRRRHAQ